MGNAPTTPPHRSLESCLTAVEELLRQIIKHGGFSLSFAVKKVEGPGDAHGGPSYVVDFSGADRDLLLEKRRPS